MTQGIRQATASGVAKAVSGASPAKHLGITTGSRPWTSKSHHLDAAAASEYDRQ
jgi:hypothetical protein